MMNDSVRSHVLAAIAQTLSSQDKVKLIELVMSDAPLKKYPLDWQSMVVEGEKRILTKPAEPRSISLRLAQAMVARYNTVHESDGRFGSSGGGPNGGSGLSRLGMFELNQKSDPIVSKVYAAEHSVEGGAKVVRGTLPKPVAPVYPKEAIEKAKASDKPGEAMLLQMQYHLDYEKYDKEFSKYEKDYQVTNLQSELGRLTLDGSKAGADAYVKDVINQDWFIKSYGDGGAIGQPSVTVRSVKGYAGQYTSGLTKNEISINKSYTQNEPVILHEIAHYAQTVSSTSSYAAHGVPFANINVHITENVLGKAAGERLAAAYTKGGVKVGN